MSSSQSTDTSIVPTSFLGRCCPICQKIVDLPTLDGFKQHAQNSAVDHPTEGKAFMETFTKMKPLSTEGLSCEIQAVYHEIYLAEQRAIELSTKGLQLQLHDEQWQALINLHDVLLQKHTEFLSLSQHSSTTPALQQLPSDYDMPGRMWRHGIYPMLERLRHGLPSSHMVHFFKIAYGCLTFLCESVPAFEKICINYIQDLARYRMDIGENDDIEDCGTWTEIFRTRCLEAYDLAFSRSEVYDLASSRLEAYDLASSRQ